jgi:N-acyl-D-amino-acid deacylase
VLDILIKGGVILDGTGSSGFYGAVGVAGDRITVLRGDVSSVEAALGLDVTGKVVCPGFIDMHAHSALMVLAEPRHEPKVHQGITTELIGIDGNSYAPFYLEDDLRRFIQLNAGLEGNPPLPSMWSSVSDYLSMYDKRVAVNIAYVVGNSPLRIGAVGWNDRPATGPQLEDMKSLLRESMEDGAFGMSTGLDYPPGSYATTDELIELSSEVARLGGIYHTHVRYPLGDRYLDPFREAIEIGRRSGVPVHITHLHPAVQYPRGGRPLLDLVENARAEGLDVTFDCFSYPHGGTRLVYFLPPWTHDGGPEHIIEVLRSPEARERLRSEVRPRYGQWEAVRLTYFKQPHNKRFEGRTVPEIAETMGKDPVDAICDLLLEEDLQTSFTVASIDPMAHSDFITHPLQMVGSDALLLGDYPPSMAYGTFPQILGRFVREERKMSLTEAIRKMTSYPAQRLGLTDRGLLRDGMKADIVVFDPDTIEAHSSREDPKKFSVGIDYVIVNGKVVMDMGTHTGVLPGRALRRGRR